MAIDSAAKRKSIAAIGMIMVGPVVVPDAAFSAADRQVIGYSYSGIAAGAAAARRQQVPWHCISPGGGGCCCPRCVAWVAAVGPLQRQQPRGRVSVESTPPVEPWRRALRTSALSPGVIALSVCVCVCAPGPHRPSSN